MIAKRSAISLFVVVPFFYACGSSSGGGQNASAAGGAAQGFSGSGGAGPVVTAGKGGGTAAGAGGAAAAGKGGSSTTGGAAGAGGGMQPPEPGKIGGECGVDAECGPGGVCMKSSGTDFRTSGPAHGYCTIDCTAFVKGTETADPCDPGDGSALCADVSSDSKNPKGRCLQSCSFGQPEFGPINQLSDGKCRGRADVACFPFSAADGTFTGSAACVPQCGADSQCPTGSRCDVAAGGCVTNLPGGLGITGDPCDTTSTSRQCQGECVRIYGSTEPPEKQKLGVCFDGCVVGAPAACGGNGTVGFCGVYNLYTPNKPGTPKDMYDPIDFGQQDIANCGKLVKPGQDNDCYWQVGFFAESIGTSGTLALCSFARDCKADVDCVFSCNVDADCGTGNTCGGGKCASPDGKPFSGGKACLSVAELSASYCLDHAPKGLVPFAGSNGKGGAGGATGAGGSASAGGASGAAAGGTGGAGGAGGQAGVSGAAGAGG